MNPGTSTEFAFEVWGWEGAQIINYAPVTWQNGRMWIHPTFAKDGHLPDLKRRATRIYKVEGSLWNPRKFSLIHDRTLCMNTQSGRKASRPDDGGSLARNATRD